MQSQSYPGFCRSLGKEKLNSGMTRAEVCPFQNLKNKKKKNWVLESRRCSAKVILGFPRSLEKLKINTAVTRAEV